MSVTNAKDGGVSVQGRMAFAGEYFIERYDKDAARRAPPMCKILEMGIPLGLGTDGTRVSSFNPWATYYWAAPNCMTQTTGGSPNGTAPFYPRLRLVLR